MINNTTSPKPFSPAKEKTGEGWMRRLLRILRWNLWWRVPLHRFYRWYLRASCGGAHHVGPYGHDGRYIVLMTDDQYHRYTMLARDVESSDANAERIHGGAGLPNQPETPPPLDGASC